jgi:hypothetical protein
MRALSILFTNNTLASRSGSELWVLDVCRALVGRGHRPIAFSLVTGAVAAELRAATVPVVEKLDDIGFTPDLIHGHHHVETLIAALHFPDVPIVHFCHGWRPWEERPLRHPSIVRYVAVDETCADRLTAENGISRGQVDLLLNFVDMKRFGPRPPLPGTPRRALVFDNGAGSDGYVTIIREACRAQGIALDVAGIGSGHSVDRPQDLLAAYDLVFARARAALEAMAVGCSVILAGAAGCGPLVTERDFDAMRAANFGVRWLQQPHSLDWYRTQIGAYDAAEAGRISRRVREQADMELAVDRLLDIYQRTLDRSGAERPPAESTGERSTQAQRAASRHLGSVALPFKHAHRLQVAVTRLTAELEASRTAREHIAHDRDLLITRLTSVTGEAAAAGGASHQVADEVGPLRAQNHQLLADVAALRRDNEQLAGDVLVLRERNQQVTSQRETMDRLVGQYRELPILRLRDRLMRIPVLGAMTQRIARTIARLLERR